MFEKIGFLSLCSPFYNFNLKKGAQMNARAGEALIHMSIMFISTLVISVQRINCDVIENYFFNILNVNDTYRRIVIVSFVVIRE